MSKELIEFDNSICPNCNNKTLNLPIKVEKIKFFTTKFYTEYTCDKCNYKWKILKY